jgi:hypothetical protein
MNDLIRAIESVNWSSMNHAYGPAIDVPDLLKALVSDEFASEEIKASSELKKKTIFESVNWTLYGNVFHQGSVWGVSATVVPFIATIAREKKVDSKRRKFCVGYLHHLAMGYPHDSFPNQFDGIEMKKTVDALYAAGFTDEEMNGDVFESSDERIEEHLNEFGSAWHFNTAKAVEHEIPFLIELLDDVNLGRGFCALAASFPLHSGVETALWNAVRNDKYIGLRGHGLLALAVGNSSNANQGEVARACEVLMDTEDEVDTFYAAAAHVYASRGGNRFSKQRLESATENEKKMKCDFCGSRGALIENAREAFP